MRPPRKNAGAASALAKLQPDQVVAIRKQFAQGDITMRQLAEKFMIAPSTVSAIVNYRTWKHVFPPPPGRAFTVAQKRKLLATLGRLWIQMPYYRLGQLLTEAIGDVDLATIEDEVLVQLCSQFCAQSKP
jgi:hypothetical protein